MTIFVRQYKLRPCILNEGKITPQGVKTDSWGRKKILDITTVCGPKGHST